MRHAIAAVAIAMTPAPAAALDYFGLVDTGELFVSSDGGATWSIRSTLPVRDARGLIAGATSSDLVLASESGAIYRSADAGASWTAVGSVAASDVVALVPCPGRLVLLTRSGGAFASVDGGASVSGVGSIPASDVAGGAKLGSALVAIGRRGDVHASFDAGASWTPVGTLPASNVVSVAAFADRLFALTATGDVARSEDLGATWSFVGTLSQSGVSALLAGNGELMACAETGEVATSVDGVEWTWRGAINQLRVVGLASDQPHPSAVGGVDPRRTLEFTLGSNPVRDEVTLTFDLAHEARVFVTVHDAAGRAVTRPVDGEILPAGRTRRSWRPDPLGAGLYWLRARAGDQVVTRRMTRVR